MAFPLAHLCVGYEVLKKLELEESDKSMFILANLAPDALHMRSEFKNTDMKNIGAYKKITHICPVSDERWGNVTDNDGWLKKIRLFRQENLNTFGFGYTVHVITDWLSNSDIWDEFRRNNPDEFIKGYKSGYYDDMVELDMRLYTDNPNIKLALDVLKPAEIKNDFYWKGDLLARADEVMTIKDNILYEHYKPTKNVDYKYKFVTYERILEFISKAAEFALTLY